MIRNAAIIFAIMGQLVVATGHRITTGTSYITPTFVDSDGQFSSPSVASITSKSFTAGSADIVFAKCRSSNNLVSYTASISSSGMTPLYTNTVSTTGGAGQGGSRLAVFFHPPSGAFTVTCAPGTPQTNVGITVLQFHGGSITVVDAGGGIAGPSGTNSTTSNPTTSTFTTSAKGLIVACFDAPFNAVSTTSGLIGGTSAPLTPTYASAGGGPCGYTMPGASQSNITASLTAGASGNWQWHVSPWK